MLGSGACWLCACEPDPPASVSATRVDEKTANRLESDANVESINGHHGLGFSFLVTILATFLHPCDPRPACT
jgi:hypothetical protein